jgi:hypothetical protein
MGQANQRPSSKEELFNLRHSSLRNVIERVFGVLKQRFPVLREMVPYPFEMQVQFVISILTIHNFIKIKQKEFNIDEYFQWEDNQLLQDPNNRAADGDALRDDSTAASWRDSIAQQMYDQYLSIRGQ